MYSIEKKYKLREHSIFSDVTEKLCKWNIEKIRMFAQLWQYADVETSQSARVSFTTAVPPL